MLAAVILFTCLCYFLPGVLLHVWLREHGLSLPVCLGLGLAGLIVLEVALASVAGYHFAVQFGLNVFVIAALAWLAVRKRQTDWLKWLWSQWPWPSMGWAAVAAIFLVPAFVITLPYDTDAQGFALLALTVRLSGNITSLAPFWPEINFFYSPAFFLLAAQLADLLGGASMPVVVAGLGHVLAVGTVGGVYAVASEFGDVRTGAWAAIFSVAGYALFSTMMDSGYTNVLGNFLTAAILVLVFRAAREPTRLNIALAALSLASLPLSHPDSIIHLLMAYAPFYFTVWLARVRPTREQYLTLTVVVPAIGVALCLPWLGRVFPLIGGINVHERQNPLWGHLSSLVALNGTLPVVLAAVGLLLALRRRDWFDIWLLGWAVMILEISTFGNLDALSRRTTIDPMQIFYPYGAAWHATIIPVPVLAAMAVAKLPITVAEVFKKPAVWTAASLVVIAIAVAAGLFGPSIIQFSKGRVGITGSLSSAADVRAMVWLRDNTPDDVFILNYPGIEGDWAPVIAERRTVHFREQLFYIGAGPAWALQERLRAAYLDPAAPESERLIREAGIDYVLVPQVLGNLASFASAQRWRPPFVEPLQSPFADAAYLELVQNFEGAQIWRVRK
jgi:hypothetical protein